MDLTPARPARAPAQRASDGARLAADQFAAALRALARAENNIVSLTIPAWSVAAATAMLGIYALVLYFRADLTLVQGDAIGHLYIARRVVDSVTPSFAQFGYIWLPLPHMLMIPFVWNDTLWFTGLGGSFVSLIVFALAAAYVHRTVQAISGNGLAGVICAALFATNPNLLFMQATPMGEAITLFFTIAATYHLVRWAQDRSFTHLILSAAFVFCGTLTRYEMWWLVPFGVAIVALTSLREDGFSRRIEALTITWGMLASYGIFLWLIYNQVIFGDPLHFIHDIGSAQSFASERAAEGVLPTKGSYIESAKLYGWAVIDITGLPLVLAGVGGFIALAFSRMKFGVKLALLLPATLFLFEVVSLTKAQSAMLSPHSQIPGFVNTRYGLLLLPALVITAGMLGRQLRLVGVLLLFAALIPQLMILPTPSGIAALREAEIARSMQPRYIESWAADNFPFLVKDRPAALVEAVVASGESRKDIHAESDWLRDHATTGKILISEHFHASAIMLYTRLPLSRFIYEGNRPFFQQELKSPGRNTDWIVYQPNVAGDQIKPLIVGAHPPGFDLVFEDHQVQIFRRRAAVDTVPRPAGIPATARLVDYDTSLGEAETIEKDQVLYAVRCHDGLATVATTRATVYAEVPCAQVASDAATAEQVVGLRILPSGDITRIHVDPLTGPGITLLSRHAWIDLRGDAADAQEPEDAVARPSDVPPAAQRLIRSTTIGDAADTTLDDAHVLFGMRCVRDVTRIFTTQDTLFADLPCALMPDATALIGRAVAIDVLPTSTTSTVRIDAGDAGSLAFVSRYVWLDDRGANNPDRDKPARAPRPDAVPIAARTLRADAAIGDAKDTSTSAHILYAVRCTDSVATLVTTKETLYAETPCDAMPDDGPFLTLPVAMSVLAAPDGWDVKVTIRDGRTLTFAAGRVWLLSH